MVNTDIDPGDDRAYTMTLQDDDKILLSGYSSGGPTGKDFALVRYNTDGTLDIGETWFYSCTIDPVTGNIINEDVKIGGMTPAMLIFRGRWLACA